MTGEIARSLGRAMLGDIGGRGRQQNSRGGDGADDQARILELTAPDTEVLALAHQIDEAVGELELHLHFGVLDQKRRQGRGPVQIAEGDGRGYP